MSPRQRILRDRANRKRQGAIDRDWAQFRAKVHYLVSPTALAWNTQRMFVEAFPSAGTYFAGR